MRVMLNDCGGDLAGVCRSVCDDVKRATGAIDGASVGQYCGFGSCQRVGVGRRVVDMSVGVRVRVRVRAVVAVT